MPDQLISRLRAANPAPLTRRADPELYARILAGVGPADRTVAVRGAPVAARRGWRWVVGVAAVAAALVAGVTATLSGHTTNLAQAFPVLNGASGITPTELSRALAYYGVSAENDGIDISHARAVSTRWGRGYVLTNAGETAICLVAPGLSSAGWGASCATQDQALRIGTGLYEYAYDGAAHSARLISLLPRGAVVTTAIVGGSPYRLRVENGVLALNITRPERITITVGGRSISAQYTPQDAHPAYGSSGGTPGGTSATVAASVATVTP